MLEPYIYIAEMSVTWQHHYKQAIFAMNIHGSHRAAGGNVAPTEIKSQQVVEGTAVPEFFRKGT
jgi:hypothetical protein